MTQGIVSVLLYTYV